MKRKGINIHEAGTKEEIKRKFLANGLIEVTKQYVILPNLTHKKYPIKLTDRAHETLY